MGFATCSVVTLYLGQLGHDEAELMLTEEPPKGQSLVGAMHQLLDALQGHLLVDLSLGWTHAGIKTSVCETPSTTV